MRHCTHSNTTMRHNSPHPRWACCNPQNLAHSWCVYGWVPAGSRTHPTHRCTSWIQPLGVTEYQSTQHLSTSQATVGSSKPSRVHLLCCAVHASQKFTAAAMVLRIDTPLFHRDQLRLQRIFCRWPQMICVFPVALLDYTRIKAYVACHQGCAWRLSIASPPCNTHIASLTPRVSVA